MLQKYGLTIFLPFLLFSFSECNYSTKNDKPLLNKTKQNEINDFNKRLFSKIVINSKEILDSLKYLNDTISIDTSSNSRAPIFYINKSAKTVNKIYKYPEGTIAGIMYYREGKEINVAEYYSNGQIMCNHPVDEDGVRNGRYICFYENGKLRLTGYYIAGKNIKDSTINYPEDDNPHK